MSFLRSYHRPAMKRRLIAGLVPPWLLKHKRSSYIVAAILSFPYWVSRDALRKLDQECRRLSLHTGVPHEVDHIIPINHPLVCGLTVPWNLQILTQRKNGAKGNCWCECEIAVEQCEMFPVARTEQYRLPL